MAAGRKARRQLRRIASFTRYGLLRTYPRHKPMIFGIGLSKTGTTSLNNALKILGLRAFRLPPITRVDREQQIHLEWPWWMSKFNAMTDVTDAVLFRELHQTFPNARFIYTWRDEAGWLSSCRKHLSLKLAEQRVEEKNFQLLELTKAFYGSILFEEDSYLAAYRQHDAAVQSHFKDDPAFLEFGLTNNPEWEPLCSFLGVPVPDQPFPKSNKSPHR